MLYLCSATLLMIYTLYRMNKSLQEAEDIGTSKPAVLMLLTIVPVMMLLSPYYMTMLLDSPSYNVSLTLQWCGLAGGLIILGVHGWLFLKRRGVVNCVVSITGAILVFIFIDSLLFVSSEKTGLLNFGYFSSISKISDVQCEEGVIIIKLADKNKPSEWRCPQGISLLGDTSKPFVPWPSYTTGKSVELTSAIHSVMERANMATKKND